MSESTTVTPTVCRRCGQVATEVSGGCAYCGSPPAAAAGPVSSPGTPPAQSAKLPPALRPGPQTAPASDGGLPAFRFEPARIRSGPRLSRKAWLAIGAGGAVVVLAVTMFMVLRPAPPSPARTVRDYFAALSSGDTAAALALVDPRNGLSSGSAAQSAPLLVPAALANAANRPSEATVTSSQADSTVRSSKTGNGNELTMVTATYKIGGRAIEQNFAVVRSGDEKTPYRLAQPFLHLIVRAPAGLAVTVNGIAIPGDVLARGTPAFPAAYEATTTGNALFAGATQAATYQVGGDRSATSIIQFGQPGLASGAQRAVQAAAQQVLDTKCVNPSTASFGYQCPLRAPYRSYNQKTTWKIAAYPQVQLSSANPGQNGIPFTTGTPGSAEYTITYASFGSASQTESGTVPINISGFAAIGDDGAIRATLGY